jgi:excisionase family DNA binding protein
MNGPFVPIEDLAKHFSVSISTIRAWVRQGHIPKDTYIKVGNTYRFSIDNVSSALTKKESGKPVTTNTISVPTGTGAVATVSFADSEPEYSLDDDI